MDIPSSFSSGLAGLQSAQSGLTQATVDVAKPSQTPVSEAGGTETSNPVNATDKTEALVSALESKNQGEAAVEVLETANETLGTVIDIKV
ncbi:chemotaxis protein [Shewanella insulae]|uniref:Chemotaxis protein n=1 Tax=Shewanella insulae TaxID=2681496 RepID=A0A6L7HU48_9GAMM|nr:chemotaxis protein [Shewanella insulae]MCG9712267.1 chemotaxis protein [Shewanella insulae]MCG9736769.1 chemotaxis protein [Shewanella insulae]MXR67470.1 chemotaxis protein [Shewanella insulae]